MTKEELIGRKFITSSGNLYRIIKATHKDYIGLENLEETEEFPLGYMWDNWVTLNIANKEIDKGEWKLIEDKPKMYKTSKGIEYGVGTQFTHKSDVNDPEGTVYTITGVSNDKIDLSWKNGGKMKQYYTQEQFSTYIAQGDWVIVNPTTKDYKQVDPKTIKFDFTNTKIKVNNEDESKWVNDVAQNNNSGVRNVEHERNNAFYFKKPYPSWDSGNCWNQKDFGNDKLKEITIQDILNNMKEVIEVGDTVELLNKQSSALIKGHHYLVDKVKNDTIYIKGVGEWKNVNWQFDLEAVKLVSKGKKKEIIAYETVVDLPGIPKGTKSNSPKIGYTYSFTKGETHLAVSDKDLQDTKFFKPIYKADNVELRFSKYTATLSKEYGLVFTDNERINYADLQTLVKKITTNADAKHYVGQYETKVNYKLESVRVGCKSFTEDDITLAVNGLKELE